ncbi:MAG: UxaA family hydrolase [Candidatus Jordarchaeaceae archaeon]
MVGDALVMSPKDNVATVIKDIEPGKVLVTIGGETREIDVKQKIPFGHKFAISKILKGDKVIKYGEVIGIATKQIEEGEHVHVHNVQSVYSIEMVKERRETK